MVNGNSHLEDGGETLRKFNRGKELSRFLPELHFYLINKCDQGVRIPKLCGFNISSRELIIEKIPGRQIGQTDDRFCADAMNFLSDLKTANSNQLARNSWHSINAIVKNLDRRFANLHLHRKGLQSRGETLVKICDLWVELRRHMQSLPDDSLWIQPQLVPGDMGVHNYIVSESRRGYFIDFEYSGFDSLLRQLADIALNPSNGVHWSVRVECFERLRREMCPHVNSRKISIAWRVSVVLWTLIWMRGSYSSVEVEASYLGTNKFMDVFNAI